MITTYIGAAFLIAGTIVFVISLLGVFRFKYVLNRIHAASVSDVLGTLLTIIGVILLRGFGPATLKYILILIAMWVTGPISTSRIARAEVTTNLSVHDEYEVER